MKRLTLLLLLAAASFSFAVSAPRVGFGLHGNFASLNVPEPLKAAYGAGFGGGLHLDVKFGVATLRVNGDYITFSAKKDVYQDLIYKEAVQLNPQIAKSLIGVEGGRVNILSFGVNGKFGMQQQAVSPYGIVGAGVAALSMGDLSISYQGQNIANQPAAETQTKFMANVGAGIDFDLGGTALFVEAKYTWIFTTDEKSTYFPVTVGLTF
jgi:hypothetical protein